RGEVARAVAAALGSEIRKARSVAGGSINDAYRCELADGRVVFLKTNTRHPRMFACEARGLAWLAAAGALRVPAVLAVSGDGDRIGFLVLEHLHARRAADYEVALGRGLAALHRAGAPAFGHDEDNYLATLEQDNTPADDWSTFYSQRRLAPLVVSAIEAGTAPRSWIGAFERLYARMPELAGPPEPPARLHGDLWSGNLHGDERGAPVLIDPAVYGGHREVDLAMLQLFGGPGARCFAAYDELHPRAPGHEDRLPLYQLYPLLAHVCLFGGSYVGSVDAALRRLI
ncbi:MAG TPA: fructosamine kinase family protein, partial [Kofleriaceae bacterium]|nr:fructosamine kinase family protein [Kofleriaceae bacterium]